MAQKRLYQYPLRLLPNRVWRTYTGGAMIERWRGREGVDDHYPEDWMGSCVHAINSGRPEDPLEALARVDGSTLALPKNPVLRDLIEEEPEKMLGPAHVKAYGANPGLLVKALDAAERLTIQVHPTRPDAKVHFGSPYGKTEAWYVLGVRPDVKEPPGVLLGFREGVTREAWQRMFEAQDIEGMQNALHRFPVKAGDVFLVEGGVPHAIGEGCFLIEVQEPTDYTFRVERTTPQGMELSDAACHQGLGFDAMLSMFRYDFLSRKETERRWKLKPRRIREDSGYSLDILLDDKQSPCFSMERLHLRTSVTQSPMDAFQIAVIVQGSGGIRNEAATIAVKQGDAIFLSYGAKTLHWMPDDEMTVLLCKPPIPDEENGGSL